jgi:hypothetical protein
MRTSSSRASGGRPSICGYETAAPSSQAEISRRTRRCTGIRVPISSPLLEEPECAATEEGSGTAQGCLVVGGSLAAPCIRWCRSVPPIFDRNGAPKEPDQDRGRGFGHRGLRVAPGFALTSADERDRRSRPARHLLHVVIRIDEHQPPSGASRRRRERIRPRRARRRHSSQRAVIGPRHIGTHEYVDVCDLSGRVPLARIGAVEIVDDETIGHACVEPEEVAKVGVA